MSKLSRLNNKATPYIIWILRIVIGLTFIISGLSKMIDVWGFSYKIEQYLNVWGWDLTRQLIVIAAMSLSAIEFVVGVLLATGCYKRTSTWLSLAIMFVMLPLSAYIMLANPVDDCGCFGDFLKISNLSTFFKNIIITSGLLYLWKYNSSAKGLFNPHIQWLVGCISYVYIIVIGFIGYNVQPLIDFRPYKVGNALVNNHLENTNYRFIYERDGIKKEFDIENLPDSTWTFIDRIELKENNILNNDTNNNIAITTFDGEDVTNEAISTTYNQLILLIPNIAHADISYSFLINEMDAYIANQGGELIGIFSNNDKSRIKEWSDLSLAQWPQFLADDTSIKEIARGKIAVVYTKNGIIQWKRTISSIPSDLFANSLTNNVLDTLYINGEKQFINISIIFISTLFLILICNYLIIAVRHHFSRKNKKKNVTLQNENK